MMRLGKKQVLTIVKKVEFGVYLGSDEDRVFGQVIKDVIDYV